MELINGSICTVFLASWEALKYMVQMFLLWPITLNLQCLEVYSTCGFWKKPEHPTAQPQCRSAPDVTVIFWKALGLEDVCFLLQFALLTSCDIKGTSPATLGWILGSDTICSPTSKDCGDVSVVLNAFDLLMDMEPYLLIICSLLLYLLKQDLVADWVALMLSQSTV